MAKKRDLWRSAADDARLTGDERERLALALARDDGLGAEVTYLLAQLSADLSGVFLARIRRPTRRAGGTMASASPVN